MQGTLLVWITTQALGYQASFVCLQEITALAACNSNNITKYYASVLRPGTTELMIVMELMACSVADLVSRLQTEALLWKLAATAPRGPCQAFSWHVNM